MRWGKMNTVGWVRFFGYVLDCGLYKNLEGNTGGWSEAGVKRFWPT